MASNSISTANAVFGKADRIKFSKKLFTHYLESSFVCGRTEAIEKVLNKHRLEPFGTVDEVIGELQLEIVASWNDFHRLWPKHTAPLSLEKVLKDQGYTE